MNWQTIESAPKDGRDILIYAGEFIYIANWSDGMWRSEFDLPVNPTHWMPLPEPPEAS